MLDSLLRTTHAASLAMHQRLLEDQALSVGPEWAPAFIVGLRAGMALQRWAQDEELKKHNEILEEAWHGNHSDQNPS